MQKRSDPLWGRAAGGDGGPCGSASASAAVLVLLLSCLENIYFPLLGPPVNCWLTLLLFRAGAAGKIGKNGKRSTGFRGRKTRVVRAARAACTPGRSFAARAHVCAFAGA